MSVATVDHDGSANFCIYSDPGIKLFGRDIPLKQEPSEEPSTISTVQVSSHQDDQADSLPRIKDCKQPMEIITCESESTSCLEMGKNSGGSTSGEIFSKCGVSKHETVQNKEEVQVEKTPKKPDKLLPCPRCNSLDTKFCYFNNYNVNQPRHFCRKCQRYWTAGGTLRNVPVGAGRRKNKHATFHQKQSMVSDISPVCTSTADVAKHSFGSTISYSGKPLCSFSKPTLHVLPLDAHALPTLDSPSAKSTILTFGQESPLCRTMAATTLGMQEAANRQNCGGLHAEGAVLSGGLTPGPDDCTLSGKILPPSCQSSGPISSPSLAVDMQQGQHNSSADNGSHEMQLGDITAPSIDVGMWQSGNSGMSKSLFNSSAAPPDAKNSATSSFSPLPPSILACNGAAGSFWPGFPWSFMHPALWGASPLEWAGPWTTPVYRPEAAAVAAAAASASFFPRYMEGSPPQKQQVVERSKPEKSLWVPKTLRIDDPLNAARSSIWTTLGLGDGPLSSPAHGPTNAFQTKSDSKDDDENEAVSANRLSNPAALSRSAAFQENS